MKNIDTRVYGYKMRTPFVDLDLSTLQLDIGLLLVSLLVLLLQY